MSLSPAMQQSDAELLEALGRGEPRAIAAVYREYGARMVAFASRYVTDRATAEDVIVNLLGRWLERPPHISSADRMAAFLATSIYHAAIDWVRQNRAQQGRPPRSDAAIPFDRRLAGPVSEYRAGDTREAMGRRLAAALERLSPAERLLLESHYGHALTAEECIADLHISRAAFHQRLHRARTRLARLLAKEDDAV